MTHAARNGDRLCTGRGPVQPVDNWRQRRAYRDRSDACPDCLAQLVPGRPRVEGGLEARIDLRVTEADRVRIERAARRAGKPQSTWLRDVVLEAL